MNPIKEDGTLDYEAAWSGKYYVTRYLYMYTGVRPRGEIKKYMDWILGEEGQKIVEEVGYIPLKK